MSLWYRYNLAPTARAEAAGVGSGARYWGFLTGIFQSKITAAAKRPPVMPHIAICGITTSAPIRDVRHAVRRIVATRRHRWSFFLDSDSSHHHLKAWALAMGVGGLSADRLMTGRMTGRSRLLMESR